MGGATGLSVGAVSRLLSRGRWPRASGTVLSSCKARGEEALLSLGLLLQNAMHRMMVSIQHSISNSKENCGLE